MKQWRSQYPPRPTGKLPCRWGRRAADTRGLATVMPAVLIAALAALPLTARR